MRPIPARPRQSSSPSKIRRSGASRSRRAIPSCSMSSTPSLRQQGQRGVRSPDGEVSRRGEGCLRRARVHLVLRFRIGFSPASAADVAWADEGRGAWVDASRGCFARSRDRRFIRWQACLTTCWFVSRCSRVLGIARGGRRAARFQFCRAVPHEDHRRLSADRADLRTQPCGESCAGRHRGVGAGLPGARGPATRWIST